MSLQVWLPLNGNLKNLGLADVTVTNHGATVSTNGKIGSCYTGTDANDTITATWADLKSKLANGNCYSVAWWVKMTDTALTVGHEAFRLGGNVVSFYWGNNPARFVWNENNNGRRIADGETTSWHHLVVAIDKTTPGSITQYNYMDGQPVPGREAITWDNSSHLEPSGTTITFYPYMAYMNDFRIYDHLLSRKEVKELSKGLIAHYPLNDCIGNENLVSFDKITASNSTISKIGNTVKVIEDNKNWSSFASSQTITLTANTTYTLSGYIKEISRTEASTYDPCLTLRKRSDAITVCVAKLSSGTEGYVKVSYTPSSDIDVFPSGIISGASGASQGYTEIEFSNIKLEIGDKATPWTPAPSDALYSEMGLDDRVVYDTSGYGRNGTVSANPPTVDSDTARYSVCSKFNGSNNFIMLGRDAMVKDEITVNAWAYMNDWSTYTGRIISCTEGGGFNFEPSSGAMRFAIGTGTSANTYKIAATPTTLLANLSPGWHMFTGTYDGLASKIYVDAALQGTNNAYTTKTPVFYHASNGIFIGAEAASNQTTPGGNYFNGKLSDVRIYATALSEDDIRELYEVSASVDNTGNFHAYELSET